MATTTVPQPKTKAQLIREFCTKNPDARNSEVIAAIRKEHPNLSIAQAEVSQARKKMGEAPSEKRSSPKETHDARMIKAVTLAKQMVELVGAEAAKKIVDAIK